MESEKPQSLAPEQEQAKPAPLAKIVSIVSGKGGVGKTTFTSNIGILLVRELRKRVLVIDGNISTANLGIHLGFIKSPVSIQDVIDGEIRSYQSVYVHKSGVHLIPASLSLEHEQHDYPATALAKRISKIVSELSRDYDYILIDGAAGISGEAKAAIAASDAAIVVTVPEIPTVTAAIKVVEVSSMLKVPVLGIVVNRVRGEKLELPFSQIEKSCGAKILGGIPEDNAIRECTSLREPVILVKPNSPSAKAMKKLAEAIVREAEAESEAKEEAHPTQKKTEVTVETKTQSLPQNKGILSFLSSVIPKRGKEKQGEPLEMRGALPAKKVETKVETKVEAKTEAKTGEKPEKSSLGKGFSAFFGPRPKSEGADKKEKAQVKTTEAEGRTVKKKR